MVPATATLRGVWRGMIPVVCLAAALATTRAETKLYTLQIPENRPASFRLELPVEHAGTLMLRVEWSIERRLALRLDAPGPHPAIYRRSDPSPMYLEAEVRDEQLGAGPWLLSIHADPAREGGEALLTLELPDLPAEKSAAPMLKKSAAPSPPPPDPWMVPRPAPAGSPASWRRLFDAIETFRALLDDAEKDRAVDSCKWQIELMRYLASHRDDLAGEGLFPAAATRSVLGEIAGAIQDVEDMRNSSDPIIAGPPPENEARKRNWLAYRMERFQPLERRLDNILETLRRGRAPALEQEVWPVRLVSCLTACERYFEERVRLGERQATNREIAVAQWERLLAAAEALEALAAVASPDR